MRMKIQDTLRKLFKGVYRSAISRLPLTSADEQTRGSWAKRVDSCQAVPEAYQEFFRPFQEKGIEFPYAVLTPSYEGFLHRGTEKLVCDLEDEVWVLERRGDQHVATGYPRSGISCLEIRSILLDTRMVITGVTKDSVPASSTIRFNSVTDYLLAPIVERIRRTAVTSTDATLDPERGKFDPWVKVSFKFMNYAKRSLLEGERVVQAIFQPEIREKVLTLLGKSIYRMVSPAKAIILTDCELIAIREEEKRVGPGKYGGVWDYLPLNKIRNVSLQERDGGLLALSVELPEDLRLEFLLQSAAKGEMEQLLDRFNELTAQ